MRQLRANCTEREWFVTTEFFGSGFLNRLLAAGRRTERCLSGSYLSSVLPLAMPCVLESGEQNSGGHSQPTSRSVFPRHRLKYTPTFGPSVLLLIRIISNARD